MQRLRKPSGGGKIIKIAHKSWLGRKLVTKYNYLKLRRINKISKRRKLAIKKNCRRIIYKKCVKINE